MDSVRAGTVTVLFTDVEASTEVLQRLGDDEARGVWRVHFDLLRKAVASHGGHEVKNLGDGLMVVFDSARNAVACSVAMQEAVYRHNRRQGGNVRVGLHVGEPIREGEDYFGMPVVLARRLCELALGGQILMSETVHDVVNGTHDVRLADRGLFKLKGFREQERVFEVVWRREETPAVFALATLSERTPFVGRKKEFAELRRLLEQAALGHGALVVVGGEPGIGKTRLAEELEGEARQNGMLTLMGHCYEMEGAPPYSAVVEILEAAVRIVEPPALREALGESAPRIAKLAPGLFRRLPDIPEAAELPYEQERRSLFKAFLDFIERAGRIQPLFIVVEDLHWASDAEIQLLHHIAQGLHAIPALIACTYRDVDLDTAHLLGEVLEDLRRRGLVHCVTLRRLPESGVSALLRARSGSEPPPPLVKHVYQGTEGNPFFVEEVFRMLLEEGKLFDTEGQWRSGVGPEELEVPRSIRLLIGRRLKRVSDKCQQTLTAAAVIGRSFSFKLLEKLADLDKETLFDAVEAAERRQLINSTGDGREARYVFTHDLVRHTLLSGLSLPRRQRLHLRVADAIERTHSSALEEHAAELAYHLYQAGAAADMSKTVHYLTLAGDRAFKASAFEEALRLHDDSLSLQSPDEPRRRAELLYKRGRDLRSLGRQQESVDDWRETLAIYERLGDPEAVGHICAELSTYLFSAAHFEAAFEAANNGLAALENRINPDRCLLLATVGFLLSNVQEAGYSSAHDLFTQALEMTEQLKDERLLGAVLGRKAFLHHAYWQGREAADAGLRAAALMQSIDPYNASYPFTYGAQCGMLWLGRLDEAAKIGAEAKALATRAGNEHARWFAGHYDSFREVAVTGDLVQFEKRRKELLEMEIAFGSGWTVLSYAYLGRAQFWLGRWDEARETLRKGAEADVQGHTAGLSDSLLFLLDACSKNKEGALAILQKRKGFLPLPGQPNMYGPWIMLGAVIESLAVLEEWSEAARLYPLALEAIGTGNLLHASFNGLVQTTAGIAAAAGRLWGKAEGHYRTALQQAHEIPYRIEQPEVRRWYARMLTERNATGDKKKARGLLEEAILMYREIVMPRHVEIAEELMERL